MSKIYLEILDTNRQQVFTELANFQKDGYLAGGTALALQCAHRISVDFDIFTYTPINQSLRNKVGKIFSITSVHVNSTDQYTFTSAGSIEITFVWFEVPLLLPLIPTSSISLASIADIAANKANTLGRRAAWRDYVDLFWLLYIQKIPLEQIILWAKQKYPKEFVEAQFLEQLVYYKDITITPVQFIKQSYSTEEIQNTLQITVSEYLRHQAKKQ
jgi:hypothetical protein